MKKGEAVTASILIFVSIALTYLFLSAEGGITGLQIFEPQTITACGDISASDVLTTNVSAAGNCFNITADNVELDCNGFTITYDTGGGGVDSGINASNRNNITVKNCIIIDDSAGGSQFSIRFDDVNGSLILNNTIYTNASASATGIRMVNNNNTNVTNNTIISTSTASSAIGVQLTGSETQSINNFVSGNEISANGTSTNSGVVTSGGGQSLTIRDNNITVNGTSGSSGVRFTSTNFSNITNNNINIRGTAGSNIGINLLLTSSNNLMSGNTISVNGTLLNRGIFITGENNTALANNITTNGTGSSNAGVEFDPASDGGQVINNTITTNGTTLNDGIDFDTSDYILITGNTILAQGTGINNYGVEGTLSTGVNITFNTITTNGSSESDGIKGISTTELQIFNNIISANNAFSQGINLAFGLASPTARVNNNIINATWSAIYLQNTGAQSNFTNNTLYADEYAIFINETGILLDTNVTMSNSTLNNPAQWINYSSAQSSSFENITFQTPFGSIQLDNFTLINTADVNRTRLDITQNNAFLNSTALPALNSSGTITIVNSTSIVPARLSVDPQDDGTFFECPPATCSLISSTEQETTFSVTSFTTYSLNNSFPAYVNESSILVSNITVNGSALIVNASNIEIDCQGFSLIGDGTGIGINSTSFLNITVKNCVITDFEKNIYFFRTNESTILNVTALNSTGDSIHLEQVTNDTIVNVSSNTSTASMDAIFLQFAINSTVQNSQANATTLGSGLDISGGSGNEVYDFFGRTETGSGLVVSSTENTTVINATGIASGLGVGLNFVTTLYTNAFNSTGTSGSIGVSILASDHGNYTNITGISTTSTGIRFVTGSENNTVQHSTATSSSGIGFSVSTAANNTILNTTITTTSSTALAFGTGGDDNNVVNSTLVSNATWYSTTSTSVGNNLTNITFLETDGSINTLPTVTIPISTTVDQAKLSISFNNAFLNSTNVTELNESSIITLNSLTFTDPKPIVDYEDDGTFADCGVDCDEISYIGGTFIFNVSHFTAFAAAEDIQFPLYLNESFNLSVDAIAEEGAIIFNASNITFDCNGNTIYWDANGTGATAIYAENKENITVQNCILIDINASGDTGVGIDFTDTNRSNIINNTIYTNGTNDNYALSINGTAPDPPGSQNTLTANNTLITTGSSSDNYGIYAPNSENLTITNTTIQTNGTTDNNGIYINNPSIGLIQYVAITTAGTSDNNGIRFDGTGGNYTIAHSTINANGTGSANNGLAIGDSGGGDSFSNFTVYNNTIQTNGTSSNFAIFGLLNDAGTNNITNNTLLPFGTASNIMGINIELVNGIISQNTITLLASAVSQKGILLFFSSQNATIENNNITITNATDDSSGIFLGGTTDSIIRQNNIVINDTVDGGDVGIELRGDVGAGLDPVSPTFNITVEHNMITVDGVSDQYGIFIDGTTQLNNFDNNTLYAYGPASYGFVIDTSEGPDTNATITNTIFNDTTEWILSDASGTGMFVNFTNTTFIAKNGTIRTIDTFYLNDTTANITRTRLNISYNDAFLNSTNLTFMNVSSQITLFGITAADPFPTLDLDDDGTFELCFPPQCEEVSFIGGTFIFNVSSWTSYSSIFEGTNFTITKTDNVDPVLAGEQLTYTITFTVNNGTAVNTTITETYPPEVTFDSASPSPTSGNDTWDVGNITEGEIYEINITVNVSINVSNGTLITNNVNLTFSNATGISTEVTLTEDTTVLSANPVLIINKTGEPDPVTVPGQINYTITINVTEGTAFNVTVIETYPNQTIFHNSSPTPTSGNDTFVIGDLSAGDVFEINITLNVTTAGSLENIVNITYQNATGGNFQNTTNTTNQANNPPAAGGGGGDAGGAAGAIQCPPLCQNPQYADTWACRNCKQPVQEAPVQELPSFPCVESWSCTEWSTCENNKQTRNCLDLYECRTTKFKPITTRDCNLPSSSGIQPEQTEKTEQTQQVQQPIIQNKAIKPRFTKQDLQNLGKKIATTAKNAANSIYTVAVLGVIALILVIMLLKPRKPVQHDLDTQVDQIIKKAELFNRPTKTKKKSKTKK